MNRFQLSPLGVSWRRREMVETTRWLFALLTLVSLVLALLGVLIVGSESMRLAALISGGVLGLSCYLGYVRSSTPLPTDLLDTGALFVFALASPQPAAVLGFVCASLWFRSLYGSAPRAVLRCCLYVVALGASVPLSSHAFGNAGGGGGAVLVGALPTMFLTVLVGRHLAGILAAREQTAQRDAVQAATGYELLDVTDLEEIKLIGWAALGAICAATPGLRVLKVVAEPRILRVDGSAGLFAQLPRSLPPAVLLEWGGSAELGSSAVQLRRQLDLAVGAPCAWTCLPIPDIPEQPEGTAWLLLGAPRKVPAEAVVAIVNLINQMALARNNSEVHRRLAVQATLDGLTGLVNRTAFVSALSTTLGASTADAAVLLVDLDDFQDVNEVLGHDAGDLLLREVAARLLRATRPQDLSARLGGDQFGVLLRGTGDAQASEVAERIVQAVAAPTHLGLDVVHVGASVGLATRSGKMDSEQLIRGAEVAMSVAKANGKARFQVFEPGLLRSDPAQAAFERALSAATNNGDLVVHYQPILTLPDGRCTAMEALVRWQHPDLGLLYPDGFIDVAERIGAIREIGAFVLRRSCADTAAWRDAHPEHPLAVHVNVSGLQLDDDSFVDSVIRSLRDYGLPAAQLVLEFTETVLISSPTAIDRLNSLAAYGVTLAIDDFGTGYSALTTLRTLPVGIVKIDKSFVLGSTVNPQDRAVTEAIVQLATTMGLMTIAEGVERVEQETLLAELGASAIQGFLHSRPVAADDFGVWFAEHVDTVTAPAARHIVLRDQRQSA